MRKFLFHLRGGIIIVTLVILFLAILFTQFRDQHNVEWIIQEGMMLAFLTLIFTVAIWMLSRKKLRQSMENQKIMLNALPIGCMVRDADFKIIDCNKEMMRLFGFHDVADAEQRFQSMSPEFQPNGKTSKEYAREMQMEARTNGTAHFRWIHINPLGQEFPADVTLVRVQQGKTVFTVAYTRDVSQEESASRAMVDAEARIIAHEEAGHRMRHIINAIPVGVSIFDENLHFLDCNHVHLTLHGVATREEFQDRFFELSPEYQPNGQLSADLAREKIRNVSESGVELFEWLHKNPDGTLIPVELMIKRIQIGGNNLLIGCSRDLRNEKSLQASLQKVEAIRTATNQVAEILMATDMDTFENRIQQGLQLVAEVTKTHRVSIYKNYQDQEGELCFRRIHVWISNQSTRCGYWQQCEAGIRYQSAFPNWLKRFQAGEVIVCSIDEIDTVDKVFLCRCEIVSLVAVPIIIGGVFWGFVRFTDSQHKRDFLEGEVDVLQTCATLFASAIVQNETQRQLARSNALAASVNQIADLLALTNNWNIHEHLLDALKLLGQSLDLDRVSIARPTSLDDGSVETEINYEYAAEGIPSLLWSKFSAEEMEPADYEQWLEAMQTRRAVLWHLDTLRGKTRQYGEKISIQTLYSIPIFVEENFWGVLRLENCRFQQEFSEREAEVIAMCAHLIAVTLTEHETKQELADNNLQLMCERERAEKLAEAKTRFLANMSHEIRTPMNAIVGMSVLLMDENLSPKQRGYITDIKRSADTLLTIINDLLDFSKLEAGKMELVPKHYNFMEMLDNVLSMLGFIAQNKNLKLSLEKIGDIPVYLYGDEVRLKQTLWNLMGNALKFTQNGGVQLIVTDQDSQLRFDVIDSGLGIREEDVPKLFQAFTQVDQQYTAHAKGTGLGLSICKSIVELMGGTISVASVYGEGATFTFVIPKQEGDASKITSNVHADDQQLTLDSTVRILVVDDNEINLNVAKGMFGLFGADIDTVLSGYGAIQKVRQRHYDLVFMDHMMPEMDGIEATKQIRLLGEPFEQIPIIALTANAVSGAKEMFLASGMNGFVSKPIDKSELGRTLMEFLPQEKYQIETSGKRREAADTGDDTTGDLRTLLETRVRELDVSLGLIRVGGNWEGYVTTLRMLGRKVPEHSRQLSRFLESEEVSSYAIEVHGVKGVLAGLGCLPLSEEAARLEKAAKEGQFAFCKKNTEAFVGRLDELGKSLNAVFAEVDGRAQLQRELGDMEYLERALASIKGALNDYDTTAAVGYIDELLEYKYGEGIEQGLKRMKELVDEFDHESAKEELDRLKHLTNRLIIDQIDSFM